jgi:hypothetical protein
MSFDVYTPRKQFRIVDQSAFRMYTADQMQRLLDAASDFELTSVHDFGYDAEHPVEIDASTEDVVYILRRK